jgi:2-haloacid dehalogenase
MRYAWILFDADATLFDYYKAEESALARVFSQFGAVFQDRYIDVYRRINGDLWRAFEDGRVSQQRLVVQRFEDLLGSVGVEVDAAEFNACYLDYLAEGTDLIEGAEDVVRALHGKVKLMVITNGLAEVQRRRFWSSAIHRYFEGIVISGEEGVSKPDPAIFDVAFARMGNPDKADVLIVGDSLTSDMRGGIAYGIDTCWFNPTAAPNSLGIEVRYEIRRLSEVMEILATE